jgi:hypothetical protein
VPIMDFIRFYVCSPTISDCTIDLCVNRCGFVVLGDDVFSNDICW